LGRLTEVAFAFSTAMYTAILTPGFFLAALCTGLMGFSIQRGATCTVAAMDEIVHQRRFGRLLAMLEASLWVAGGLLLASLLGLTPLMPHGYALSWPIFAGAALLGLGAFVNRGCVFGAIARLGSGEWSYLATPVGFFLGCLAFEALQLFPPPAISAAASPVWHGAGASLALFAVFLAWRLQRALRGPRTAAWWTPRAATVTIGIAFVAMLVLVGESWAYTEVLAEMARGVSMPLAWRVLLLLALFGGALAGGVTAGRFRHGPLAPALLARCCVGGFLMGFGSLMIPGSNDGLILLGMPLLWPHAWLAFLTMCASVGAALLLQARRA
jgi:hypothetical protein